MFTNNLQDDAQRREDNRIASKRAANEQRRQRYLNAKVRLIGLDVQGLNEQVREKQAIARADMEREHFERLQALEVERIMARADHEEKEMRKHQLDMMRQSWDQAVVDRRDQNARDSAEKDYVVDNCGMSSALKFSGEDTGYKSRRTMQAEQMRRWIQEQMTEKANARDLEREEEMNYAEMMAALNELRLQTENEEAELRQYIQNSVRDFNKDLGITQRNRNAEVNQLNDNPTFNSLNLFNEDRSRAMDANGRVVIRDAFKGFTNEQRARILSDNQQSLIEKRQRDLEEKQRELDWAFQQMITLRAMEEAEFQEREARQAMDNEVLSDLRRHMHDNQYRRMESNRDKYGQITNGFFDGFGKSCR